MPFDVSMAISSSHCHVAASSPCHGVRDRQWPRSSQRNKPCAAQGQAIECRRSASILASCHLSFIWIWSALVLLPKGHTISNHSLERIPLPDIGSGAHLPHLVNDADRADLQGDLEDLKELSHESQQYSKVVNEVRHLLADEDLPVL